MRKRSKKIFMINAIFLIASFSIVSLGFANWIVNGSIDTDYDNVSISINNDINNKSLVISTLTNSETDLSVVFDSNGSSQNVKNPGDGFYITGSENNENLSFTLTYEVISFNDFIDSSNIYIELSFTNYQAFSILSNPVNYVDISCLSETPLRFKLNKNNEGLNNNEYIETSVTYETVNESLFTYYKANITQKFTFYWGSVFNNQNPGEYENTKIEDLIAFSKLGESLNSTKLMISISGGMN